MLFRKIVRCIEAMPHYAYIFLRATLKISCGILFLSFLLFLRLACSHIPDHALYMTAITLLETPSGLLLLGIIGTAILIDRS